MRSFENVVEGIINLLAEIDVLPFVVIGSGPAGWAALEALVAKGKYPTLIDIGQQAERSVLLSETASPDFSLKTRHGLSYMYDYPKDRIDEANLKYKIPLSGAFGGLSTVWGTNLQLCREACLSDAQDDEYTAAAISVLNTMFHSGSSDDLDEIETWLVTFKDKTPQSDRMQKIQRKLSDVLRDSPLLAGMARNATLGEQTGCTLCGACMSGCNYGAIFSTERRIEQLISEGKINVFAGIVDRISSNNDLFKVSCTSIDLKSTFNITSSFVFLAAGSIASTAILMKSGIIPDHATLRETQVAYLPILVPGSAASQRSQYSLAQVFVESRNGLASDSSFHMSIYEPSDEWPQRIKTLRPILGRLFSWVLRRYVIAGICFLPSSLSGRLHLQLSELELVKVSTERNSQTIREFKSRLRGYRRRLSLAGVIPMVEFAEFPSVGSSFHVGVLEVDGRRCLKEDGSTNLGMGLHVVDGTALQVLPTGPVTLSIMVNATMIVNRALIST